MNAVLKRVPDFRPMRNEDIDAVLSVEQASYAFPWSRANFADSLAAGYAAWNCHVDGELVGYAVMMLALDEAQLLNLTVAPAWQRNGYGGVLVHQLMSVARTHGARRMLLEVRPSNRAAQALYAHIGFRQIGRRRGYYPAQGGREDAIVMAVEL